MENKVPVKNIAVIGSGVSGLGAIWALKHSNHRVCLYEANSRLGGHAHAVNFRNEQNGTSCMVDTAFMIINDTTYRTFISFILSLAPTKVNKPTS
jgi:predicted NAD/FAD-binding protein